MRAVCRGEGWRPARTQILWSLPGVKISQLLAETFYTEEEARKLGVVGWVKNTSQGTVTGQVQGPEDKVNAIYRTSAKYSEGQEIPVVRMPGGASEQAEAAAHAVFPTSTGSSSILGHHAYA
ncbi:acylphosphatase-2 isoform X1 [Falco naumanni]|uniref:acylphosphatase-2 isoform X1 n=1 Tax=Falco naumanni TaxID=148594 RepID=UPI001ADE00D1|nr:acylphosphatase-2 isoform X1 [Falco naumanni]